MALSNTRQWDQYEHPMGEHLEQERVLRAIDQLFEDSNLFNLPPKERFPDLIERSTSAVRESVADALDEHRGKRIDNPTEEYTDADNKPISQQIFESETGSEEGKKGRLNKEFFGGKVRGWFRKLLGRPTQPAEFLLEPKESRGLKTFAQREVLGATYFLDPERAERIMTETDPNILPSQRKAQFKKTYDLLGKKLGKEVWSERQSYAPVRFAMSFIANMQLTIPSGFNIYKNFVEKALGGAKSDAYEKAVQEAEKAEKEYNLMKSKIDEANGYVDDLRSLAIKLRELCPEGYKGKTTDLGKEISTLKDEIIALKGKIRDLEADRRAASDTPTIESIKKDIALKEDELKSKENELKPKEDELKEIEKTKASIIGKKSLLKGLVESMRDLPSRKALLDFINETDSSKNNLLTDTPENIDKTTERLAVHKLRDLFNPYSAELTAKLKADSEKAKVEKEKALKAAEEVKDVKLTPEELVYKLFHYYFTHRKKEGGFLDDNIPDSWIAKQNVSFQNNLRDRALLATRFAISEAKDQAVFAQLYANKNLAEHVRNQKSGFAKKLYRWGRESWAGNKIATAFGRPEQVSFDKMLERIRTIETTKDGKLYRPFSNLELKWITTRGDLRKAIETKKLDEDELPRLASYLEMILKESDKIEIRPQDAEMFYRTIRNLKLVRQEILHKKFMLEVQRTPGSMPEKLRDLWKTKWAAEEQLDAQMVEEARKREFIAFLERDKFLTAKKALRHDIINKLRSGEMSIDDATAHLADAGYKVGRLTGLGLWSRMTGRGAKEAAKGAAIKGMHKVGEKLAPVAKKLGIEKKSDVIGFFGWTLPKTAVWNVPKGILWSSKIRGKEHDGVLKYAWKGVKQVVADLGSVTKTALTNSGTAGSKPAASH